MKNVVVFLNNNEHLAYYLSSVSVYKEGVSGYVINGNFVFKLKNKMVRCFSNEDRLMNEYFIESYDIVEVDRNGEYNTIIEKAIRKWRGDYV